MPPSCCSRVGEWCIGTSERGVNGGSYKSMRSMDLDIGMDKLYEDDRRK